MGLRVASENGNISHATPHSGGYPWQTKFGTKNTRITLLSLFHTTPSQDGISEVTNYDLIQRRPRRGESLQQQVQQRTLPGPSTTTNAIRNYPGNQLDLEKAQDVGPAYNRNHHYVINMRYQARKKRSKLLPKHQRILQIGIRGSNS